MDKISIAVVSWYSSPDICNLFESITANTVDSQLEFVICDNSNGKDRRLYNDLEKYCKILPHDPLIPNVWNRKRAKGSYAHGSGLNKLLSMVSTEYCLFSDPDCLVISKGWDVVCKKTITGDCIAIGAPYHSRKITKYHNFPSPIFNFFRTSKFRELEADWTPYLLTIPTEIQDQFRRVISIMGSLIGENLYGQSFYVTKIAGLLRKLLGNSSKDTGWRIPSKVRKFGYKTEIFTPAVIPGQLDNSYVENKDTINLMNEYELFLWKGIPLLTHFYGYGHRRKGNVEESANRWRMLTSSIRKLSPEVRLDS